MEDEAVNAPLECKLRHESDVKKDGGLVVNDTKLQRCASRPEANSKTLQFRKL